MNRRKWLLAEAKKWQEEQIISAGQYEQIANRYQQPSMTNVLPILGSILLGLAVLTFIASNWQGIGTLSKLMIILVSLTGAYAAGEYMRRKGHERLGTALTMVGITIYGAGFFLIGQMFQLSSSPLMAFYLWFAGAVPLAWYYRSRAITWMSLGILVVSAIYGMDIEQRSGLVIPFFYLIFAAGVVPLTLRYRSTAMMAVAALLLMVQALYDGGQWSGGMHAPLLFLAYYLISQLLNRPRSQLGQVLQAISYLGGVIYAILLVLFDDLLPQAEGVDTILTVMLLITSAISAALAIRKQEREKLTDILPFLTIGLLYLFAPVLTWLDPSVIMIVVLAIFSIGMIMGGERTRETARINLGAVSFGLTCLVGYIHYAWDFMDKSLFFLIGGLLLLLLSFFVERARRRWVNEARGNEQ